MCNTFAVYFQIFATFGYKKVKNSEFKSPVNLACSWYLSQLMSPLSTSFVPKLGQS